jgi:hypothetical protein
LQETSAGLPDGTYKIPIWVNFGGLAIEGVGTFCGQFSGHLVYYMAHWYIYIRLVFCTKKIWQLWTSATKDGLPIEEAKKTRAAIFCRMLHGS